VQKEKVAKYTAGKAKHHIAFDQLEHRGIQPDFPAAPSIPL
jgi:hypothetical protein